MKQSKMIQSSYTLHEAMQLVLSEKSDKQMHASDLADEVYQKGLYYKRNGKKAETMQIRARSQRYSRLFEVLNGNIIRLR